MYLREQKKLRDSEFWENFVGLLHENKLRMTPERKAVVSALASRPGKFFTAQELKNAASETGFEVKINTVYNTLALLSRLGFVKKKNITSEERSTPLGVYTFNYETSAAKQLKTELFIKCTVCGRVKIARDNQLTNYIRRHHFAGFITLGGRAEITLECICRKCGRAQEKFLNQ